MVSILLWGRSNISYSSLLLRGNLRVAREHLYNLPPELRPYPVEPRFERVVIPDRAVARLEDDPPCRIDAPVCDRELESALAVEFLDYRPHELLVLGAAVDDGI